MRWWLVGALCGAFGSLAFARYAPGTTWIVGLWCTGSFLGFAAAFAVSALVRHHTEHWIAPSAALVGFAASVSRATVLSQLDASSARTIDMVRIGWAGSSLAWSILGFLWGAYALSASSPPPSKRTPSNAHLWTRTWIEGLAGLGIAGGLYGATPLLRIAGIRITISSVLGLLALALLAYLCGIGYRRHRPSK